MDKTELRDLLGIVFEKEKKEVRGRSWKIEQETSGDCVLSCPTSDTLLEMYSNIQNNGELKNEFLQILEKSIISESEERWMGGAGGSPALCFYTLLRLGFVDKAIQAWLNRKKSAEEIVKLIFALLENEFNYFNIEQLEKIKNKIRVIRSNRIKKRDYKDYYIGILNSLEYLIVDNRYNLLKKVIRGVNVEINLDKKTVFEKIDILGLDDKYKNLVCVYLPK